VFEPGRFESLKFLCEFEDPRIFDSRELAGLFIEQSEINIQRKVKRRKPWCPRMAGLLVFEPGRQKRGKMRKHYEKLKNKYYEKVGEPRKEIHIHIKNKHPKAVSKSKNLFKFKYPKLALLFILIIVAYILFQNSGVSNSIAHLNQFSYVGGFISGILFSFGFSVPFAIGYFIVSNPSNIFLFALIGGLGASLGDLIIFKTIKFSFMDEFESLEKTKTFHKINLIAKKNISVHLRHYLTYILAGITIATPLPDEIGVTMLAGLTTIKPKVLALISLILHTIAIYLILIAST